MKVRAAVAATILGVLVSGCMSGGDEGDPSQGDGTNQQPSPPPPPPPPPPSCCASTSILSDDFQAQYDIETDQAEDDARTIGRQYSGSGAMYIALNRNLLEHVDDWIANIERDTRDTAANQPVDPAAIHDLINEFRANWDAFIKGYFPSSQSDIEGDTVDGMNDRIDALIARLQGAGLAD